ncbi:MAG: hypothetical protein AB4042_00465 [Leptolyngbyaceae cyanobacterium]
MLTDQLGRGNRPATRAIDLLMLLAIVDLASVVVLIRAVAMTGALVDLTSVGVLIRAVAMTGALVVIAVAMVGCNLPSCIPNGHNADGAGLMRIDKPNSATQ